MIIGYVYQFADGTMHVVNMRAALNIYMEQTKKIMDQLDNVVCKWIVKRFDQK